MKRLSLLILPVLLALSGCASIFTNPAPGSTVAEVIALKGQPDAQYQDGNTTLLEWSVPAYGDHAWMARIGPDGKLISYKQVLTRENFGSIRINEFTKNDVLKTVGHPTETEMSPLSGYEIWSYRYLEEGIWHSMMHVFFDSNGVVRKMENGQDPMYLLD
ncbi:hypothetical protein [uncultured Oxalobacter sp.]|uniref:hypothetical protein n=1 Tax=uncultured Oxalobacter sp. TaxID=337245 RepID=UPI0025944480|nr:hypothetical protein [uncultured Oxalobacter sp.]